jgi:hypothetical protein
MTNIRHIVTTDGIKAAYNKDMRIKGNKQFNLYLKDLFNEYLKSLKEDWTAEDTEGNVYLTSQRFKDISKKAEYSCKAINEAIDNYLNGQPSKAYDSLKTWLDNCQSDIENFYCKKLTKDYAGIETSFYRIRIPDTADIIDNRSDIFHPPFEKKHSISMTRFSISGYPCLHMSQSLYAAWEEMRRPLFNKIYFSRFTLQNSVKVLNIAERPIVVCELLNHLSEEEYNKDTYHSVIKGNQNYFVADAKDSNLDYEIPDIDKFLNFVTKYLEFWPLQLACSIPPIPGQDVPKFHAEYIIPQLLMQWLQQESEKLEERIDGICYRSTQVSQEMEPTPYSYQLLYNYAFPAKKSQNAKESEDKDFCPYLKKMFKCSTPVSLEYILSLMENETLSQKYIPKIQMSKEDKNSKVPYFRTAFGKAEIISKDFLRQDDIEK